MAYPRLGESRKLTGHKLCALCQKPDADLLIFVEFDIFRGNDVGVKIHKKCVEGLKTSEKLARLVEYLRA